MAIEFDTTEEFIFRRRKRFIRPLKLEDYENLLPFALHEPERGNIL